MNAAEVAEFAMSDYVAESDAEPRKVWFSRREVIAVIVVALAQFSAYAWQAAQTREANDRTTAAESKAARLDGEMVVLQQRCTVFDDGSATCPAGVFETKKET